MPTPQDRTLFDGIYSVPPGHYLLASGGQVRLIRYWDFDYPAAADAQSVGPDAEYAERFRHALDEAVRLRLRADVPVGYVLREAARPVLTATSQRAAQAPVPRAARGPHAGRAAVRTGARDPARPRHGLPTLLRPGKGRRATGRPARAGGRRPHRPRPRPDGPPECMLPAPALHPMNSYSPPHTSKSTDRLDSLPVSTILTTAVAECLPDTGARIRYS